MKSNNFSWEIVLAGIILTAIAIYFTGTGGVSNSSELDKGDSKTTVSHDASDIVIKSGKLADLKKLDTLTRKKDIDSLVIDLPNLNKTIKIKRTVKKGDSSDDVSAKIAAAIGHLNDIVNEQISVAFDNNTMFLRSGDIGNVIHTRTISAAGIRSVSLHTSGGSIKTEGYDGKNILVTVSTDKGTSKSQFDKQFNVRYTNKNGVYSVNIHRKDSGFHLFNLFSGSTKPANIIIKVPRNLRITGTTSGGSLSASNINNEINLKTSGGIIELHNIKGNVTARTSGGIIRADHLAGKINLHTSGGSIHVADINGELDASTSGGNIDLTKASGKINARTSAGNITAVFTGLTDNVRLRTSAGNIHIKIPSKAGVNLDLNATRIHVNDNMAVDGTVSQGTVRGKLNGGGKATITANTSIGNVTVN
jgi:hypothetical protein